jgi:HNH endonuclease
MTVADELARRFKLWEQVSAGDADNVDPSTLRSALVYGGVQGIWVDKKTTGILAKDGVTVGILHTGRHYPDDLSDDGLIYHYPATHRPLGRDTAEVQATKNAAALSLPIFVILPGTNSAAKRCTRLGWVADFDDENRQFLILFGKDEPKYQPAPSADTPFSLTGGQTSGKTTAKTRPGQQRFRFQVIAKYGYKCAVCAITHPSLMKAAHICGKAHNGSDDWRNGLPLCSTHHDAFDAHLFAVQPDTLVIETMPSVSPSSIGITVKALSAIHGQPHSDALSWRFVQTNKRWAAQNEEASQNSLRARSRQIYR